MKRSSRSLAILLSKDLCCFSPQKDHRNSVSSNGFTRTKKLLKDNQRHFRWDGLWMIYGWLWQWVYKVYQPRKSRLPPSASLTLQPWHDGCEPVGYLETAVATQVWLVYCLVMADIAMKDYESHGPVSSLIYRFSKRWFSIITSSYVSLPEGILFGIPFQCYGMVWECPLTMNMICSCKTTGQNRPEVICGHFKILGMACAVSPSLDIARWFLKNSNILRFCPTPGPVPPAMPPKNLPWLFLDQGHRRPKILLRLFGNLGSSLILPVATWQVYAGFGQTSSVCFIMFLFLRQKGAFLPTRTDRVRTSSWFLWERWCGVKS